MNPVLDLKLFLLVTLANGMPVLAKTLFGPRLAYPVDFRIRLTDGNPLFGATKSIRGVLLALFATAVGALIVRLDWRTGLLVAALAMAGDLCSSFLKRRMDLPGSSMALGLDQLPESFFPMLGCAFFLPLTVKDIAAVVASFFVAELLLSRLLFALHLRDRPY